MTTNQRKVVILDWAGADFVIESIGQLPEVIGIIENEGKKATL
ncbi:hypothetical protein [Paenibacillus sp. FSL R10-2734]